MHEHYLDEAFRKKLAQANWEEPPDDWHELELRLHEDALADLAPAVPLDDLLMYKLEDLSLSPDPDDWDRLRTELDQQATEDLVRQKLENHRIAYAPADWESMNDWLDVPFDETLSSRIRAYRMTYRARDWHKMEARLQAEGLRRPGLLPRKISYALVAACLGLLLLSRIGILVRNPHPLHGVASVSVPAPVVTQTHPYTADLMTGRPQSTLFTAAAASLTNETPAPPLSPDTSHAGQPPLVAPMPDITYALAAPVVPELQPAAAGKSPVRSRRSRPFRLGVWAGISPTRVELSGPARPGVLAALRLEIPINKQVEVISGLGWSSRSFSHEYYVVLDRPYLNAVDGMIEGIEIPLSIRYRFPSKQAVSVYAQAGMATLLSLREEVKHFDPNAPPNADAIASAPRQLRSVDNSHTLNTYPANVNAALGLEIKVSRQLSILMEAHAQQGLQRIKGLDALNKRLYSTGVGAGIVYGLRTE
ncbi:MAG: outer membrane beta-barrel protein [Bacteroidia bacterium]|nr:outer membrane beta-barrel protein [Bacteroidia bacterium]